MGTDYPSKKLGDVADFVRGITFKPDDVIGMDTANAVACMRTKNVQSDLDLSDVWGVPASFVKRDEQYLREGDILVSSANSWNLVGKCSWVPKLPYRATLGGFISCLRRISQNLDERYLFHWFSSEPVQALVRNCARKTTNISNLSFDQCLALEIPLPPLEEQKRIAAILDQADDIRRKRKHAIDRLNQLGQAIFYEMFGDPVTNPMGWDIASLGSVCMVNPRNDVSMGDGDEVTFLPMAAVSEQGEIISEEFRTYGSVKKGFSSFCRGDVLLAKITPCFENGKSARTDNIKHSIGFGSTEFHVVRPSISVNAAYLFAILHGNKFRSKAEANMTGSAGQKRVPTTYLKECKVPLPPLEMQEEFAKRVDEISGNIEKYLAFSSDAERLFTSLQHRAFTGQL